MNITVTKNQVSINTDYILNDKEYNVNKCYFTFSDEYTDDLVKKAIFVQGTSTIEMSIINNQCQIPAEVLNNGQFELRVYAYEVDGEELLLRYSPSYTTAYVRTGSYIENAESPEVITPTQFEQYMQAMNDGLNEVANVDIDAEQLDNGMSVTITNRYGENKTVYAYDGEKGETGATGATGNGIASITKTSTSGLTDTYTITFTNGNTTIFTVSNGNGILSIEKTGTVDNVDTYTIYYTNGTTSTFTVTNSTVTDQEFETLETEVNKYKTLSLLLPKVTGEGSNIELNNTVEGVTIDITPEGNTEQTTYTGKNLLNNTATSQEKNGITYTINSDGTVIANGTATSLSILHLISDTALTLSAGTYILSGCPANGSNDTYRVDINDGANIRDYGSGATFTLTNSLTVNNVRIRIASGTTINNLVFKPMIEQGSIVTDYEPYVGGVPSPNPEYPQDVRVVKGDNTIKINGKNLLDTSKKLDGYAFDNSTNKIISSSPYELYYIPIKAGETYISSSELGTSSGNIDYAYCNEFPQLNTSIVSRTTSAISILNGGTFTAPSEVKYLLIRITKSSQTLSNWQIEKGSTATDYEPYQNQTYPIYLGDLELCKIGDYQDYIYKENYNWYLHKEIGKVVLNGSETMSVAKTGTANWYYDITKPTGINADSTPLQNNAKCNYYPISAVGNSNTNQGIYVVKDSEKIRIRYGTEDTTTNFKNWLSTHNTIVYYVLETPTTTEITDTTLINQLNNLYSAVANQDKTFIECTSTELNNVPLIVKVSTYKDISSILNPVI